MQDNALIFQILGVILVLFFCFLTYMNTRVWRVTHVLFAFLTFSASIGFLVYAALTIKTHSIWKDRAQKLQAAYEKELEKTEELRYGKLPEIPPKTHSRWLLGHMIGREVIDRGRVWRGCMVTGQDAAGGITLSTVPADWPQGTPPQPNHMSKDGTFHAFKEMPIAEGKVPYAYLGQYHASALTDTTVTLLPVLPLSAQEKAALAADPQATWVLYETMPVDGHDVFAGMTEDELKAMMPQNRTTLNAEEYEAFIKNFARDGGKYDETDPPETKWVRVRFNKAHKVPVDGPTPMVTVNQRNAFDLNGQAILPRLQRGGEVEFDIGDEALFYADDDIVRGMITDNTVTLVENVFVRQLADYEFMIGHTYQRIEEINDRIKEITRDLANINASIAQTQKQVAAKEAEKLKVEQDLKFVKYERDQLAAYSTQLDTQVKTTHARMNELYRTNVLLEKELKATSERLTEEIDKKTEAAGSLGT